MSRETGLNSNYADEVRIWAKKEIARLEQEGKARKSLAIRVDELNKKNIEENKELKEENKTLKDANLSSLLSERALLKQIKELKEELDSSFSALEVSLITSASVENEEENEKLKEENEKLKKQKKNLVRICRSVRKSAAESQRGDMIMKLQRQARERHQEEEEEKKPEDFLDFAYELGGPALLDAIDSLCAGASKVW
tara:strand:+ start:483 stop:1073 length:591 start_codon:yes stop_codon:yes gene_type:complete